MSSYQSARAPAHTSMIKATRASRGTLGLGGVQPAAVGTLMGLLSPRPRVLPPHWAPQGQPGQRANLVGFLVFGRPGGHKRRPPVSSTARDSRLLQLEHVDLARLRLVDLREHARRQTRQIDALTTRVASLEKLIEKPRRAGKQQAPPFSKGEAKWTHMPLSGKVPPVPPPSPGTVTTNPPGRIMTPAGNG